MVKEYAKRAAFPLVIVFSLGFAVGVWALSAKVTANAARQSAIDVSALQVVVEPSLDQLMTVEAGVFKYQVAGRFLLDMPLPRDSATPVYWLARVTMPDAFAAQFMPWVFEASESMPTAGHACDVLGYAYLGRPVVGDEGRLFGRALSMTCESGYLSKTVRGWFLRDDGSLGVSPVVKQGDAVHLLLVAHALELQDFIAEIKVEADALQGEKAEQEKQLRLLKEKRRRYWNEMLESLRKQYGDSFQDVRLFKKGLLNDGRSDAVF